jgi:prepilin-type processing-associated H-X9-DG protein
MRDLLIRYLLGELSEAELLHVEERLRESPELRRELQRLRACFDSATATGPESDAFDAPPPPNLARRITEQVTSRPDDELSVASAQFVSHAAAETSSGSMSWSLADLAVAAGVFLAVSTLVLPALRGSRDTARRHVCAANQKDIGYVLTRYAADNNGRYPRVDPADPAGIFASRLVDEGYVEFEEMKQMLMCPASHQRQAQFDGKLVVRIPTVEELCAATGAQRQRLLRQMLYSYGYRIGYVEGNAYHCVKKQKRTCQPIFADAPLYNANGPQIANHGGLGFNVLYADGSVSFLRKFAIPGDTNLYLNLDKKAAAGHGQDDAVLVPSVYTPDVELPAAK